MLLLLLSLLPIAYQLESSYSVDFNKHADKSKISPGHTNEIQQALSFNTQKINPPPTLPIALNYLTGTDIDGYLALDNDDNLIIDQGLLDFFDYFLSARGRLNEQQIVAHLVDQLTFHLQGKARIQALEFLHQYQLFGNAYSELVGSSATSSNTIHISLTDSLDMRQKLRYKFLGVQTSDTLWAEQDAHDQITLLKLMRLTPSLSSMTIKDDEYDIISSVNRGIQQSNAQHKDIFQLQKNNANSAYIYQKRALTLGVDAADRLTVLDRKSLKWKERMNHYLLKKDNINNEIGLTDNDKEKDLLAFKNTYFTQQEQRRLLAYEIHPQLVDIF
jgi:lipase chaperone LimK